MLVTDCCALTEKDLPQWIKVAKCCGVTGGGDLRYTDPEDMRALIQFQDVMRDTQNGTERQTRHLLITMEPIGNMDLIWLPDASDECEKCDARQPLQVAELFDPQTCTVSHYEVIV